MVDLPERSADWRSPLKSRMWGAPPPLSGSTVCGPGGSQRVEPSVTGQELPSTLASPDHETPRTLGESIVSFDALRSACGMMAPAAGSNGRSGARMEFSK